MATERLLSLVRDDWESHRDACRRQIAFFCSTESCTGMSDAERALAIEALRDVVEAYSQLLIKHASRQAAAASNNAMDYRQFSPTGRGESALTSRTQAQLDH